MEKLIELLNEHEKELNTGLHWRIDEIYWMLWRWLNLMWVDQYLISKHYWFIKWLVENDKVKIPHELDELPAMYWYDYDSVECKADRLLMLLAIQYEPIQFLISLLK